MPDSKNDKAVPLILIVEENSAQAELLEFYLKDNGYACLPVGNGGQLLELAQAWNPALIIVNSGLTGKDCFEVTRLLKEDKNLKHIPTLLTIPLADKFDVIRVLESGADNFITQPFELDGLLARIHELMNNRGFSADEQASGEVEWEYGGQRRVIEIDCRRFLTLLLSTYEQYVQLNRETEKALLQIDAATQIKDDFLALISHELRTPLNAILGWSSALLSQPINGDFRQRALEIIERSARAQTQLIDDLLDMARAVSGKLRLEIQPVDLADVIQAALEVIRPAAEAKSIRLRVDLQTQGVIIPGDPNRLQQIFWNLLSNAIKFTPPEGKVEIKLERINNHAHILVRDTGCGISPDFLPHVFERFRQADSSNTRPVGGMGLGLALVQELVEMHGGAIQAHSDGINQGATFTVSLPFRVQRTTIPTDTQEMLALHGVKSQKQFLLAGLTILVAEGDPHIRALLTHALEQYGGEVLSVRSAAEAFNVLSKVSPAERPDVLVTDILLPDEDGSALLQRIRTLPVAQGDNLPAIALTAFGRSSDRVRALAAGFQMHVPKPVEPAELALVIANLLRRSPA